MKANTKRTVAALGTAASVVAAMGIFAVNDIANTMKTDETASAKASATRDAGPLTPLNVATAKPSVAPKADVRPSEATTPKVTASATVTPLDNPANIATVAPQAPAYVPAQPVKPYVPCSAIGEVSDANGVCHTVTVKVQTPTPVPTQAQLPVSATGPTTDPNWCPRTGKDELPGMCNMASAPSGAIPAHACPEGLTWSDAMDSCGRLWVDPNPSK